MAESLTAGTKVVHADTDKAGTVSAVLSPTYVAVRWFDGTESEEHVADLAIWKG